jgi:hypothetical protein
MISVPSPGWSSRILIEVVEGSGVCSYGGEDHEKREIEVFLRFLFARRLIYSSSMRLLALKLRNLHMVGLGKGTTEDVEVCEMCVGDHVSNIAITMRSRIV